jgi:hypothetical protein
MITIDVADLVLIAGEVLGTGPEAALGQLDIAAAQDALAAAQSAATQPSGPEAEAAAATVRLMHALLRYRPFPGHGEQIAVAAGLQFLALNGWQADLDPPGAALAVIEAMARGQLSPAGAAAWLSPRLSPYPASLARRTPMPTRRSRATRLLAAVSPVRRAGIFTPVTGFLPFTYDTGEAVIAARQEADRAGLDRPGPEQFLLALTATGQGAAAEALQRLGISPEAVREQLTAQHSPQPPRGADAPFPMQVMPRAVGEAIIHNHDYIGTEHILLALFHAADDTAAQALTQLGASESDVRGALAALLPGPGPSRPGHRRGHKPAAREEEIRRLRLEVAQLSALLREHGIEPGEGRRRSA